MPGTDVSQLSGVDCIIVSYAYLGQGKAILLQESIILGKILNTSVIPGKKVCASCRIKMYEI